MDKIVNKTKKIKSFKASNIIQNEETQSYDLPKSTEVLNWIEGYYPVAREHPIIPG